jgi:hypothetical protein
MNFSIQKLSHVCTTTRLLTVLKEQTFLKHMVLALLTATDFLMKTLQLERVCRQSVFLPLITTSSFQQKDIFVLELLQLTLFTAGQFLALE